MNCCAFVHDWLAPSGDAGVWWKLTRGPHLQWAVHQGVYLARVCIDPPGLQLDPQESVEDLDQEEFHAPLPRAPFWLGRRGRLTHATTGQVLHAPGGLTHIPCTFQWPTEHPVTLETAWLLSDWQGVQTWLDQTADAYLQLTLGDDLSVADRRTTLVLPWASAHTIDRLEQCQAWVPRLALRFPADRDGVVTLQWSNALCRLSTTSDEGWMADRWIPLCHERP